MLDANGNIIYGIKRSSSRSISHISNKKKTTQYGEQDTTIMDK